VRIYECECVCAYTSYAYVFVGRVVHGIGGGGGFGRVSQAKLVYIHINTHIHTLTLTLLYVCVCVCLTCKPHPWMMTSISTFRGSIPIRWACFKRLQSIQTEHNMVQTIRIIFIYMYTLYACVRCCICELYFYFYFFTLSSLTLQIITYANAYVISAGLAGHIRYELSTETFNPDARASPSFCIETAMFSIYPSCGGLMNNSFCFANTRTQALYTRICYIW